MDIEDNEFETDRICVAQEVDQCRDFMKTTR
jgi:hypothetical protein